jgi:hypothetical protein
MWNGKSWRIVPSPSPAGQLPGLSGVSCVSTTWCFAVGGSEGGGLLDRWNGTTWTASSAAPGINKVSCASRNACAGFGGSSNGTFAKSWNGHVWTKVAAPRNVYISSISCPTVTLCKAVGDGTAVETNG